MPEPERHMAKSEQTTAATMEEIAAGVRAHMERGQSAADVPDEAIPPTSAMPPTTPPPCFTPLTDPMDAGITHIRSIDPDALRIWTVKGPKEIGGTVSAVLMNTSEVVILHQFASGRFGVFKKVDL